MRYTRNDIISRCKIELLNVSNFYNADFINYRGKTSDTGEFYTEIIAEFVCKHLDEFENISKITRESSYKTSGHDGSYSVTSNRLEEITAMQMFNQCKQGCKFNFIGEIIDYQTPLKNKKTDDVGKIDLLSVKDDTLLILELKKEDSVETMLRCVLEGFTYLKTIDTDKLIEDFQLKGINKVCASPFVFLGKRQWKEMQEHRPQLKRLMKLIDSKPYYISMQENKFVITED